MVKNIKEIEHVRIRKHVMSSGKVIILMLLETMLYLVVR